LSQNLASSLAKLTPKERLYVESRLGGLSKVAAASAAGYASPKKHSYELEKKKHIQAALVQAMHEIAEEIGFTRKEAHEMLMSAYMNAATAAEQIQAVKEMIALHGIAAPKQVEHKHEHTGTVSLERMETHELMKLADMEDLVLEGEFDVVDDQKSLPKL
jgi:phage terminase small subunit